MRISRAIPEQEEVRDLFAAMYRQTFTCHRERTLNDGRYVAWYAPRLDAETNRHGPPAAFIRFDTSTAAWMASELAMMPPARAAASIAAGELDDTLFDVFREAANICVHLMQTSVSWPRMRLAGVSIDIPDTVLVADRRRTFELHSQRWSRHRLEIGYDLTPPAGLHLTTRSRIATFEPEPEPEPELPTSDI
jgi:hypothetical protein